MQLEETIAKELAGIVNEQFGKYGKHVKDLDTRLLAVEIRQPEKGEKGDRGESITGPVGPPGRDGAVGEPGTPGRDGKDMLGDDVPADVIDEIAKAIALLAEAPPLQQPSGYPVVVNFSPPNTAKKIKTITTRRDEAGNLVARVIED